MYKWILPTLSEVLALSELTLEDCQRRVSTALGVDEMAIETYSKNIAQSESKDKSNQERAKAEKEWRGAIAALEQLLVKSTYSSNSPIASNKSSLVEGIVMSGPVPVLSHTQLLASMSTWLFTMESLQQQEPPIFQLPPAIKQTRNSSSKEFLSERTTLPLLPEDPLQDEQFCLVLTANFSTIMVLGETYTGVPAFLFSFDPEVVKQAWQTLRARLALKRSPQLLSQLDNLFAQYYPVPPDYRIVTQFSRLLLRNLPEVTTEVDQQQVSISEAEQKTTPLHPSPLDVELLQAFAHEVRTPLTTIRTMTRLLLKRRNLGSDVIKRLEIIDHECTEQIDRMELLFRAAELERSDKDTNAHLTATSLSQVLQQSVPRWQKQASRRNLTLDVILPQQLPTVVSDPRILDQVLTGLVESFTRNLPAGSHIQVQVIPAGDQMKLQMLPLSQLEDSQEVEWFPPTPTGKSLGQLLTFQPETGNISLNLAAAKHLFQAIGGKLIVRQRPDQSEVLTIFLPLDDSRTELCH